MSSAPHRLATTAVSAAVLRLHWLRDLLRHPRSARVSYTCNLCGNRTSWTRSTMGRESRSCARCGSTVRFRALFAAFERHVMDPVPESRRRQVRGLGFSDPEVYARAIAARCDYTNTFLDDEPRRDLLRLETFGGDTYDFVVCSEVMEHVVGSVDTALANLAALLRPGGTLLLTVPAVDGPSEEHYPGAVDYTVERHGREHRVLVTDAAGNRHRAAAPVFHGGPGSTLEMRVWGRADLRDALARAGFTDVVELVDDVPEHGILHAVGSPELHTRGGTVRGLHSGVWVATRPRS